jgi:hypothetical protein
MNGIDFTSNAGPFKAPSNNMYGNTEYNKENLSTPFSQADKTHSFQMLSQLAAATVLDRSEFLALRIKLLNGFS